MWREGPGFPSHGFCPWPSARSPPCSSLSSSSEELGARDIITTITSPQQQIRWVLLAEKAGGDQRDAKAQLCARVVSSRRASSSLSREGSCRRESAYATLVRHLQVHLQKRLLVAGEPLVIHCVLGSAAGAARETRSLNARRGS